MKKLSFIALGIIIGIISTLSFSASADSVKQYILTKIGYPIMVNGQEYSDPKFPALNYEGTTYLPLKGIGNVLGTAVKWNDQLKRVEVGEEAPPQPTTSTTPQALQMSFIPASYIFKVDGKVYTPDMTIFMLSKGSDNKYYINFDFLYSVVTLMQIQNKSYTITPSNNPYVDGVLAPNSAENVYERKEKYLSVNQRYTETTIYNPLDRSKFYYMSTQPGQEIGLVKVDTQYFVPADDIFVSLGINVKIDWDKDQKVITFTY